LILNLIVSGLSAEDSIPRYNISLGYGFPNFAQYSDFVKSYESQPGFESGGLGPIHLKFEYRYNNRIGLGLNVNYMDYHFQYVGLAFDPQLGSVPNVITIKSFGSAFNLRVNYYFNGKNEKDRKTEFYCGMGAGYNWTEFNVTSQYDEFTPVITFSDLYKLGLELTAGCRFKFTKNIAAYTEIGYAKSILQFGLTGSF
jgi:opacity protein-like surface antigen